MMRLWHLLQRYRRYRRQALWIVPFTAIILEQVAYRLVHALDDWLGWQLQRFSAAGAQALLETVITMTLSFIVFTFGSLLVAIQVAGGQLTPRIIATTLLRDNVVRYTVGLFVFTLLFAISALNRIKGTGDQLVLFVAAAARPALDGGLSILDRLCSATVAARQHSVPGRRRWPYRDRGCLSSADPRSIAAARHASDCWDAFPDRLSYR